MTKPSLALSEGRGEALTGIVRGKVRGFVWIGAALLVLLAVLSWPNLVVAGLFVLGAAALVAAGLWSQLSMPDVRAEDAEPVDPTSHERD